MTAKPSKKPDLIAKMDEFASDLIKSVKGNTISGIEEGGEFKAKVDVFNAVTRWVAIKHKVYPEEEERSGLERLIDELKPAGSSGASGGSGNPTKEQNGAASNRAAH